MTERITKPKHAITVTTYAELQRFVGGFVDGHLNLVILVGLAGISKSETVRRAVGPRVCWLEGNATSYGIYQELYRHIDELVVIDDVDSLYADKSAVRLLKCLCQTNPVKQVAWNSAAAGTADGQAPRAFSTRSKVCIIANDWKVLDANVAAVQDRGHLVFFEPSREEIHLKTAEWFWDQDVFNWMADHLHLIPELSMRHYVRAYELKQAGIDWVKVVLSDSVPEKALAISKLLADTSFAEERQRAARFRELGYGSVTTYYKWLKRVRRPGDSAALKVPVRGQSPEQSRLRLHEPAA